MEIERKGNVFEVKGVPQKLMDEFSTRRLEIEKVLAEKGFDTAKAAAVAALNTREVKQHVARGELFSEWRKTGEAFEFGRNEAHGLCLRGERNRDVEAEAHAALQRAIEKITAQNSHFTKRDVIRAMSEEAQGKGISANEIQEKVKTSLANGGSIVRLGTLNGEARYTTAEMLAMEQRMMNAVDRSRETKAHAIHRETVDGAAQKLEASSKRTMSDEQKAALKHITEENGGVKAVSGMAGTGKTFMLQAAREAWEAEGFTVRGVALAGKAADGLQEDAGISSSTIARFLQDTDRGRSPLTAKTILVVDEAGMIDTRQMSRLVEETQKAGAKLVLVGDAKQLQPIEAGGPFKAITERIGAAQLTDIRRQSEQWARTAVKDIADGNARAALTAYAERGQLIVSKDNDEARRALISGWKADGVNYPKQNLIITNTRLEAAILNRMAQAERDQAGELKSRFTQVSGEMIHEGDRVLFTRNSNLYGVKNGNLGTVERVSEDGKVFHARLDSGKSVTIPTEQYDHVKLGYAITTHKGQGMTAGNAFVLAGGEMQDLHQSYVQMSRGRGVTKVYTTEEQAGENLKDLSQAMSQSHQKELALTLLERSQRETPRL